MTICTREDWIELFLEAKELGLSVEEVKDFLDSLKGEN
ncbi:DNA-binding anti-repressor SinI [Metabacillus niabensis]|uniref:DNA-binding transcriptional MerR regulator n=1 Tax=Metabacillus niabensis TaxID=324854 RepID=A0ABT9Z534_9BACI|nr:DNA-binding anti-repressor SinI [Metabacillus niabensis]MDQ0227365.1 DNA-binding transcriptional MerR regulator [Metabacillus niabensis]PAD69152.1 hypothetical protein CHH83_09965 [Bacillus sp. 7586-K]